MTFELTEPILLIGLGGVGSKITTMVKKSLNADCLLISHDQKDIRSENGIKISTKSVVNPSSHLIRGYALESSDNIKKNIENLNYWKDIVELIPRKFKKTKKLIVFCYNAIQI